jgi:hypothetical protein
VIDRASDMRHILSQIALATGGTVMEADQPLMFDAAREQSDEEGRIIGVYLKKNRISLDDLSRMNDEQVERLKHDAFTNRHLYPVPRTEAGYLYHGTSKTCLPQIKIEGLKPSEKSRWERSGMTANSLGRVFFTSTVSMAEFYGRHASRKQYIFLRVRLDDLPDRKPDTKEEEGSFYVERSVPPSQIEMWTGKGWSRL